MPHSFRVAHHRLTYVQVTGGARCHDVPRIITRHRPAQRVMRVPTHRGSHTPAPMNGRDTRPGTPPIGVCPAPVPIPRQHERPESTPSACAPVRPGHQAPSLAGRTLQPCPPDGLELLDDQPTIIGCSTPRQNAQLNQVHVPLIDADAHPPALEHSMTGRRPPAVAHLPAGRLHRHVGSIQEQQRQQSVRAGPPTAARDTML